jgi:hypothetical protein
VGKEGREESIVDPGSSGSGCSLENCRNPMRKRRKKIAALPKIQIEP